MAKDAITVTKITILLDDAKLKPKTKYSPCCGCRRHRRTLCSHSDSSDLKKLLIKEPVLKFYYPTRPVKISSDASQSELGAVLMQKYGEWQPAAYASRSITNTETRYAQIEKEMLRRARFRH